MSSIDQSKFLGHSPPEDTFNDAVDQLVAGTPLADILESVPVNSRDELSEMLSIVEFTQQVQTSAVPMPSRAKRARNKASFLAVAQAMNTQAMNAQAMNAQPVDAQEVNAAPLPQPRGESTPARPKVVAPQNTPILQEPVLPRPVQQRPVPPRYVQSEPSFFQRLSEAISDLFTIRTLRFAPLILLLGLILVGSSSIFSVQASIPGDFIYPVKQWVRNRQIATAPIEERDEMLKQHEIVVGDEVRQAVVKSAEENVDIEAQEILLYYGMEGRRHAIGDLLVSPWYQPDDATEDTFDPMVVLGQLSQLPIGTEVRLEYQVVPGQADDDGKPVVQGVTLEVIATPEAVVEVVPTPLPTVTDMPSEGSQELVADTLPVPASQHPPTSTLPTITDGLTTPSTAAPAAQTPAQIPTQTPTPGPIEVPAVTITISTPEPKLGIFSYCEISSRAGWTTHIVRRGDTLWDLANRSGTTIDAIKDVNCLKSDRIIAGDWLNIPPLQHAETPVVVQANTPTVVILPTLTSTPQPSPTLVPTVIPPTAVPSTQTPLPTLVPVIETSTEVPTETSIETATAIPTAIPTIAPPPTLAPTLALLADTPAAVENNGVTLNYDATAVPLITATGTPELSDVATAQNPDQNSETAAQLPTSSPTPLPLATSIFVTATIETIEVIEVISTTTVITIVTTPLVTSTQLAAPTSTPLPLDTLVPVTTTAEIVTATALPAVTTPVTPTLSIEIPTEVVTETYPVFTPTSTILPDDVLPIPSPTPESIFIDSTITPTLDVVSLYTATPVPPELITTPDVSEEVPTVSPPTLTPPTATLEVNASANEENATGLESIDVVGIPTEDVPVDPTATWTPEAISPSPTETSVSEILTLVPTAVLTTISVTETDSLTLTEVSPTEIPLIEDTPEPPTPTPESVINITENNAEENPVEPAVIPLIEDTPEPPTPMPEGVINTTENNAEGNSVEPTVIPLPTEVSPTEISPIENTPEPPTPTPEGVINTAENNAEGNSVEPAVIPLIEDTPEPQTPTSEVEVPPTEISPIENTPEPPTPTPEGVINTAENNAEGNSVEPAVIPLIEDTPEPQTPTSEVEVPPTEISPIENTPELPTSTPTPDIIISPTETNIEESTEETIIEPIEPTVTPDVIYMFPTPTVVEDSSVDDSNTDSSNTDVISTIEEAVEIPNPPTAVPATTGSERISPLAPPSSD